MNPIEHVGEKGIIIEESKDADYLLRTAKSAGLDDVDQWTSKKNFQTFLDAKLQIAFIAVEISSDGLVTKSVGEIIGGYEEEGRIWIELLVVDAAYRRKGVASALVQKLALAGKELGYRGLFVDVDSDDHDALKFYKAAGFENIGSIKHYYYDETDAVILLRRI